MIRIDPFRLHWVILGDIERRKRMQRIVAHGYLPPIVVIALALSFLAQGVAPTVGASSPTKQGTGVAGSLGVTWPSSSVQRSRTTAPVHRAKSTKLGPASVTGYIVTTISDENSAIGDPANCPSANNCSLRDALAAVAAIPSGPANPSFAITFAVSGTIMLNGSLVVGTVDATATVAINGPTSGPPVIIDGANAGDSAFVIPCGCSAPGPVTATFTYLTIQNSSTVSFDGGGAIDDAVGAGLNVDHVTFIGDTAGPVGGAISAFFAPSTITNSTFTNNNVFGHGGLGGAIWFDGGVNVVSNTIFTGNTASGDQSGGGAIFFTQYDAPGSLTLDHDTFDTNSAGRTTAGGFNAGGAVAVENNSLGDPDTTTTVTNTTFTNNKVIVGGAAFGGGGAFAAADTDIALDHSVFTNNSVTGGQINLGGALYLTATPPYVSSHVPTASLTVSAFAGNQATTTHLASFGLGGAIFAGANLFVTNSTLTSNQAGNVASTGNAGGAIFVTDTQGGPPPLNIALANDTITANRAFGVSASGAGTPSCLPGIGSCGGGVAILASSGTTAWMTNTTIANNIALDGGGVESDADPSVVRLVNSIVSGSTNDGTTAIPDLAGAFAPGQSTHNVVQSAGSATGITGSAIGVAPLLGPLGDYGSTVALPGGAHPQTLPLLPGSPAFLAGDATLCADNLAIALGATSPYGSGGIDARGVTRPQITTCDSGAFESRGFTLTAVGAPQQAPVNTLFPAVLKATLVANDPGAPVSGGGPVAITFTAPVVGATATLTPANPMTDTNGAASVQATANSTPGSYAVTAQAAAPSISGSITFTLTNQATTALAVATATTFVASTDQTVTLRATVSASIPVNEGAVTFTVTQGATTIGTSTISATVANGAASAAFSLPGGTPAGTYTITAVYRSAAAPPHFTSATATGTLTITTATLTGLAVSAPIALSAPPTVKVGQQAQLTALATLSDGSTPDVTGQGRWTSDHPEIAQVDVATGNVTGVSQGAAMISATYTLGGVTKTGSITLTVGAPTFTGVQPALLPQGRPPGAPSGGSTPAPAPGGR
jgi:hypothetical protein